MEYQIRQFNPNDLSAIKAITVEGFTGVSLDHAVEEKLGGKLAGHDWRWRKARHIDDDAAANPEGIFVVELDGEVAGYISTVLDREAGRGRIPNLAVSTSVRGQGIGRALIERAVEYFRAEGMAYAAIETMASNPIGQRLYPDCGFEEVARQVHYARRL
jgi:ribosomal protein S18 acetylase RimI-like enzyme